MSRFLVVLIPVFVLSACIGSEHQGSPDVVVSADSTGVDVPNIPDLESTDTSSSEPDIATDVVEDSSVAEDTQESGIFTTIDLEMNPNNHLSALVHVVTAEEASVRIRFGNEAVGSFETPWSPVGSEHDLVVVGMRADSTYAFELIAKVDTTEIDVQIVDFTTGALPQIQPFEVTVHRSDLASDAITFFGVGTDQKNPDPNEVLFMAVDKEGEVIWYYNDVNTNHASHDREVRPMPDGSLMLSLRGSYRFIDLAGNTLYELKGGPSIGGPLHHDVVPLPNGNYLTFTTEQQTYDVPALGGSSLVTGDRILEMSPLSLVTWSWSAFDHMDDQRFPSSLSQNEHPKNGDYDWTHANGMQYYEDDDSVIVSFRHQHWVTKINRATGDVVWKLGNEGDFTLLSGDWFYGQHAPEMYPDGRILVFDNGNDHPNGPPYSSRGVMYQLDLDAMTAEEIWSYQMPDYGSFLGDIDLLDNGHIMITGGGVRIPGQPPQTGDSRIHEVTGDDDPQLVWELRAIEGTLYRATRVDSFWP